MARRAPFLKTFGLLLMIFIGIPVFIWLREKAILPVILYFQILILWGQLEVSQRQHALFAVQYEPTFSVRTERCETVHGQEKREFHSVQIQNTSSNVAYNIMVGRVLDKEGRPINPGLWKEKIATGLIANLPPGGQATLCSIDPAVLKGDWSIEVDYTDQLGEWKEINLMFSRDTIIIIPASVPAPGFLLELLSKGLLYYKFLKWERITKRK